MSPFISIIIPFYGTADPVLLQRCLDSIRRQGMEEGSYEIIVADDESQTTGGARNNGMQQAHGEYLFFVDADDVLLPNTLPSCLSLLRLYSPDILKFGFQELTCYFSLERQNLINQSLSYVDTHPVLTLWYSTTLQELFGRISSAGVCSKRLLFISVRRAFLRMKSLLPKLTSLPEKCW